MAKYKVLVTAPPILPNVEEYRATCLKAGISLLTPDMQVVESLNQEELVRNLKDIDAILCGDDELNFKALKSANKLKVISKWGTGIDSIDTDSANKLDIKVFRVKDVFGPPLSDTVLSYMLLFSRRILEKDLVVRERKWQKVPSFTLAEKTLGIIGLGHAGKELARKAYALGMKVFFTDIVDINLEGYEKEYINTDLKELLSSSDFVSLHCDLNKTSHHLINKEQFELMKKDSIIINTARGSIINEEELINALDKNIIGGAALDVFETEPLPDNSKLRNFENVFLSPHNSNASPETFKKVDIEAIKNIFKGLGLNKKEIEFN